MTSWRGSCLPLCALLICKPDPPLSAPERWWSSLEGLLSHRTSLCTWDSGEVGRRLEGNCYAAYPFLVAGVFTEAAEHVLHAGQAPRERQEQVHHLVQVPDEHLILVNLIGLAELTDPSLHLLPQGVIELDVHQQAPLGFLEGLELVGEASDQLRLS